VPRSIKINDPFARSVEIALEHFADPAWLGAHSPLAAPYFLGEALDGCADAESAAGRGRVLQSVLRSAAQALSPEQRQLLNVAFFKRDPALNNAGVAMQLNLSETTYYRHRAAAIEALADEVNRSMLPPWRMDMPRAQALVNRAAELRISLEVLQRAGTVALVGPGGIGKTALGAALVREWGERRAFWYTVRPGLNDQFNAVAFALAHFLRSHGAALTWRQLIADRGVTDPARILMLLRHDLAQLDTPPVICVDEVDVLRDEREEHARFVHLLESLRSTAPMIWIGQQVLIEADRHVPLAGLADEEVAEFLARRGVAGLSAAEVAAMRAHTRGNPALITLAANLWRDGERLANVLQLIASAPPVEPLLSRTWKRLGDEERSALMALAVFDGAAPRDAWPDHQRAFDALVARELALASQGGAIQLPSYVREFVRRRTPRELSVRLHLAAGEVFESRGEYTAAARHYAQGGQPALAIWAWFNHRDLEIDRGHAATARAIFAAVRDDQLEDEDDRRVLAMLRAELALKAGAAEEAEAELSRATWPLALPATPLARQLQGDALEAQGQIAQALEAYRQAWRSLDAASEARTVALHIRSGYIHINRDPDLQRAKRDATLALWQAHHFMGHVQRQLGQYAQAEASLNAALRIAQELPNNKAQLARTHQSLSALFVHIADAERAIHHARLALQFDREIGDTVSSLFDELNLSSALIIAQRHEEALDIALSAAARATEIGHAFLMCGCYACAAEACFYLGRLDDATRFAQHALAGEEQVFRPCALMVLGWVKAREGALAEAERLLAQAVEEARESEDRYVEAQAAKSLDEVRGSSVR
jgi:tetratricopeptide (TPR) repeat protein